MALPFNFQTEKIIQEGRVTKNNIDDIKKWLQTTTLPEIQDEMIAIFLVSCCCDLPATKNTIISYFKRKHEAPEIFQNRDIDSEVLQQAMKVIMCVSIPRRMPNNTVIHFFRLTDTNYKNFDLVTSMKLGFMLVDVSQRYNPPSEMIVVVDMKGSSLMHLTTLKLGMVKKFLSFMQEGMPIKIQKIHILNANYIFERALAMARVFLRSELIQQIVSHPPKMTMEEFHKDWIPAECLPKDYGGDLDTCDELNQRAVEQFRELKKFYQLEEELVARYSNTI